MKANTGDDLRVRILDEAAKQFDKKGIKFTMDDLARSLGMSKKTIYTVFEDKRSIMTETIDRFFDDALIEEEMILNDDSLTIVEQLKSIIGRVPERYTGTDAPAFGRWCCDHITGFRNGYVSRRTYVGMCHEPLPLRLVRGS